MTLYCALISSFRTLDWIQNTLQVLWEGVYTEMYNSLKTEILQQTTDVVVPNENLKQNGHSFIFKISKEG